MFHVVRAFRLRGPPRKMSAVHSLRFQNSSLQRRLLADLQEQGVAFKVASDGAVQCSDQEWSAVNAAAHRIRDTCFPWYFSWLDTAEETAAFAAALREAGLSFELEHHDDRKVFLLPKADQAEHHKLKIQM
jgi:hypothetical protein